MSTVVWFLDDYEMDQFYENPQLFETNLFEKFGEPITYQVIEHTPDTYLRLKVLIQTK